MRHPKAEFTDAPELAALHEFSLVLGASALLAMQNVLKRRLWPGGHGGDRRSRPVVLYGGVFLAGGAARLPDLCDVAARVLDCQTRYGLAIGIVDWPVEMDDPEWTTAAGLAMYSAKLKAKAEHQREAAGWLGKILR